VTAFIGNFCFFPAYFLLNFSIKKPGIGYALPGLGTVLLLPGDAALTRPTF
jgi:hypothetical protein